MSWTPQRLDTSGGGGGGGGTTPFDFQLEVAKDNVTGHTELYKFGYNDDVDGPEEAIWSPGGQYTGFITTAGTASVVSTSASDTAAGTGAQAMLLVGLDSSYNFAFEVVVLNGTTPVVTTTSWFRIYRMRVETAGSTENNVGVLTATVGGNLMAQIEATQGQTEMLIYAVPTGSKLYLDCLSVEVDSNSSLNISLYARYNLDTNPVVRLVGRFFGINGVVSLPFNYAANVPGPADIWVTADDGGNSSVSAQGIGIEVVDS